MTLNGKTSGEGVEVAAGSTGNAAKVEATSPTGQSLSYHWLINKDERLPNGTSMPDGITGLIAKDGESEVTFTAPTETGGYRLYVFVTDQVNHKSALACIPFLVK